jgi:N-acetylglucosamine-6-phosphate deacetylase
VTLGAIADGVHLHPTVLEMVLHCKTTKRVVLTTDQNPAAGLPPGKYRFGGIDVASDGIATCLSAGRLAGSAWTIVDLIRIAAALPGFGVRGAIEMASLSPARTLSLDRRFGRLP